MTSPKKRPAARKSSRNNVRISLLVNDVGEYLKLARPAYFWESQTSIKSWAWADSAHNIMLHIADRDKILEIFRWVKHQQKAKP